MEEYPKIDSWYIEYTLASTHWKLNGKWLEESGIKEIPTTYIDDRVGPPFLLEDLWEYMRELIVQPTWLTVDFDTSSTRTLTPIWQLIPHLNELTAFHLKCELEYDSYDDYEEENQAIINKAVQEMEERRKDQSESEECEYPGMREVGVVTLRFPERHDTGEPAASVVDKWFGVFLPSQLNQLQHVALELTQCMISNDEVSKWLKKMPNLQSLWLDFAETEEIEQLEIPPLTNLQQLSIRAKMENRDLIIPVLPALKRLYVSVCYPKRNTTSHWIPNLAQMTALETLTRYSLTLPELRKMSCYLPTQIQELCLFDIRRDRTEKADDKQFWTNMKSLTQLKVLKIPQMKPTKVFMKRMKRMQLTEFALLDDRVPSPLAAMLPEMTHLRSLSLSGTGNPLAAALAECTQLTQVNLDSEKPQEMESYIAVLPRLPALENVSVYKRNPAPLAFYALHLPALTQLALYVAKSDLPAFGGFLERHPTITHLNVVFGKGTPRKQTWQILAKCPVLEILHRKDMEAIKADASEVIDEFAPSLRRITWNDSYRSVNSVELPSDYEITHYQAFPFEFNIRRHQTLVGLHTDMFRHFWPTDPSRNGVEWYDDSDEDSEDDIFNCYYDDGLKYCRPPASGDSEESDDEPKLDYSKYLIRTPSEQNEDPSDDSSDDDDDDAPVRRRIRIPRELLDSGEDSTDFSW